MDDGLVTNFIAESITDPSGDRQYSMSGSEGGENQTYVSTKIGSIGADYSIKDASGGGNEVETASLIITSANEGWIFRSAWAGWGIATRCTLRVNGTSILTHSGDPGRGLYALNTDFSGGAAIAYGPRILGALPLGLSPDPGASALQGYAVPASGYLFAFLAVEWGAARMVDPAGNAESTTGNLAFLSAATTTDGTWRMYIDAAVSGGPVLWAVVIPDDS